VAHPATRYIALPVTDSRGLLAGKSMVCVSSIPFSIDHLPGF
jgi:hypothetical protein